MRLLRPVSSMDDAFTFPMADWLLLLLFALLFFWSLGLDLDFCGLALDFDFGLVRSLCLHAKIMACGTYCLLPFDVICLLP